MNERMRCIAMELEFCSQEQKVLPEVCFKVAHIVQERLALSRFPIGKEEVLIRA